MARRVKDLSGNENAVVLDWRERKNASGESFYEIDIR
jgi:hypothetical protein